MGAGGRISERGLTLVEIMVVLVILGVVLTGITIAFTSGQKEYVSRQASIRMQQQARLAVASLERDLRMTGHGLADIGNLQINVNFPDSPWSIVDAGAVASSAANTDAFAVRFLEGEPEPATAVAGKPVMYEKEVRTVVPYTSSAPSEDTVVTTSAGFKVGDLYLVNDRNDYSRPAVLLQVTAVTTGQLSHKPNVSVNPSGGSGSNIFPPGGYPAGARVLNIGTDRLRQVGYYIDANRNLVRWQKNNPLPGTPVESRTVAAGIEDLQLKFQLSDAPDWKDTITKAEVAKLRTVKVSIIARSERPEATFTSGEVFQLGGTYGNGVSYSGGGYRRMILSSTIHLRNLAMRP